MSRRHAIDMWVSPCEIIIAASIMNLNAAVQIPKVGVISEKKYPKWIIKLEHKRLMLYACHRKPLLRAAKSAARGGMHCSASMRATRRSTAPVQPQMALHENYGLMINVNPAARMAEGTAQQLNVIIEGSSASPIISAQMHMIEYPTMWGLRRTLGRLLDLPPTMIEIYSPKDHLRRSPFPDWLQPEGSVIAAVVPSEDQRIAMVPPDHVEVEVSIAGSYTTFKC